MTESTAEFIMEREELDSEAELVSSDSEESLDETEEATSIL